MGNPKKRGQNEGTVYQLPSGRWRAQVTLPGGKRLSYSDRDKRKVERWRREQLGQIDDGLTSEGAETTIAQFFKSWLDTKEGKVRVNTHLQYTHIVNDFINPHLGQLKLRELTPDRLQRFYDSTLKELRGTRTLQVLHGVISRGMKHAQRLQLIRQNPAGLVEPPSYQSEEMMILDEEQISRLLVYLHQHPFEPIIGLALATGMRQGELLGLTWKDVDFEKRTIYVHQQAQVLRNGQGTTFTEPKTKRGRRVIEVGTRTLSLLRLQRERCELLRRQAGEEWAGLDLVFPNDKGGFISRVSLYWVWQLITKAAGLPLIRFHDLRHTAASMMIRSGVPITTVSYILGHSSSVITLKYYGHLVPSTQAEAAEKMDALITPVMIDLPA